VTCRPPAPPRAGRLDHLVYDEALLLRERTDLTVDTRGITACQVFGDASLLSRAVRNLLDNAARHAATRITITVGSSTEMSELTVADDGPGVPEAERTRQLDSDRNCPIQLDPRAHSQPVFRFCGDVESNQEQPEFSVLCWNSGRRIPLGGGFEVILGAYSPLSVGPRSLYRSPRRQRCPGSSASSLALARVPRVPASARTRR